MSETGGAETNSTGNNTRGERVPAIERATGRAWADWVAVFDAHGARSLGHAEIAKLALATMPHGVESEEWWAQGVAIAFEQHAGLRVPGQSSTGTFRVSASRTLPLDRDAALAAWVDRFGEVTEHLGHAVSGSRSSRTEKRSFWRFSLDGAGKVEVAAALKDAAKDQAKTILAISQEGLDSGDRIEEWRAYWKAQLAQL
ncbi:hypothetical protein FB468_2501 [Leucobacter komagatae]|uniref:DUF4287 domain-containing protein n=1 Tax=Leucobacter komagatae TaxID=55969 RepID=A0A542Y8Y0_9MICO|nr:hypothetical protein [Leucobacter komagatae]TQL44444.1 hypothetical protein FB468_2501 [Leucobacter komagatae]